MDTGSTSIYDLGEVYDAVYKGRGKDYAREAEIVAELIRARRPCAASVLDVGCGTGAHLVHFAEAFPLVHGIDVAEGMLRVARRTVGNACVEIGDMRTFAVASRFDAVVCLFSAVGNLSGPEDLNATLRRFAQHLRPGGVVVVEPWWFPHNFVADHVGSSVSTENGRTVARVSHTIRHDTTSSRMEVHYVVASAAEGIWHFSDTHVMTLFRPDQFERAFRDAGLDVEHVDGQYPGNGLFVGTLGGDRP